MSLGEPLSGESDLLGRALLARRRKDIKKNFFFGVTMHKNWCPSRSTPDMPDEFLGSRPRRCKTVACIASVLLDKP